MTDSECPSPDELRQFAQGEASWPQETVVATHLDTCPECVTLIDSWSEELRLLPSTFREHREDVSDHERQLRRKLLAFADLENAPQLPNYEIIRPLGAGGMGVVYLARHKRLERTVAIKTIRSDRSDDGNAQQRFQRECAAIGRLRHPNIVDAIDAGTWENHDYLVMEHLDGVDISNLIRQHTRLPLAEACSIVRQAAVGLQYIHEHGYLHRDIKPSNLFRTNDGVVKILDLGLTRPVSHEAIVDQITSEGVAVGTWSFMAPEQQTGEGMVDGRSDVFALGATLFKLLTGEAHFVRHKHPIIDDNSQPACSPGELVALPSEMKSLLRRMLDQDPKGRPSAADVAQVLSQFTEQQPDSKATKTEQSIEPAARSSLPLTAIGILLVVVASVIAALVLPDRSATEEPPPDLASLPDHPVALADPILVDVSHGSFLVADPPLKDPEQWWALEPMTHRGSVREVQFSPDGEMFAVASASDPIVRIYSRDQMRLEHVAVGSAGVNDIDWAKDSRLLALACVDGKCLIWDVQKSCAGVVFEDSSVQYQLAAFSPDATQLATSSLDGDVAVWNIADSGPPRRVCTSRLVTPNPTRVMWSRDGSRIAFSTGKQILDVDSKSKVLEKGVVTRWWSKRNRINFYKSHDEASQPNRLRIVDESDQRVLVDTQLVVNQNAQDFCCCDDGDLLVTVGYRRVDFWQPNGECTTWKTDINVRTVDCTPDGKHLVIGGEHGRVTLLRVDDDVSVMGEAGEIGERTLAIKSAAWSSDDRKVAFVCEGHVRLFIVDLVRKTVNGDKSFRVLDPRRLQWSPDDDLIALLGSAEPFSVEFMETALGDGQESWIVDLDARPTCADWSSNRDLLVACDDGVLRQIKAGAWTVSSFLELDGTATHLVVDRTPQIATHLVVDRTPQIAAIAYQSGQIAIVDVQLQKTLASREFGFKSPQMMSWDDGRLILRYATQQVVWDWQADETEITETIWTGGNDDRIALAHAGDLRARGDANVLYMESADGNVRDETFFKPSGDSWIHLAADGNPGDSSGLERCMIQIVRDKKGIVRWSPVERDLYLQRFETIEP